MKSRIILIISLFLLAILFLSIPALSASADAAPNAGAVVTYTDISGHWAAAAIQR